jgi:MoxR-like ATPase
LGYPSHKDEGLMLERLRSSHPIDTLKPVVSAEEVIACQKAVREVHVDQKVRDYILDIVHATRDHQDILLGGSPRASIALYRASQALAGIRGHDFITPDDVKRVAPPILSHRMILRPESRLRKITPAAVVEQILTVVAVPTMQNA